VCILHVVPDRDQPHECVAAFVDAVPSGSYVVLSHVTDDIEGTDMAKVAARLDERMRTTNPPALRNRADVTRFLLGLEILEPGVVPAPMWRPDDPRAAARGRVSPLYAAVARKP
ncbi:MAG TPA: SAM-dependent methyltransferase, partial [Acidimicrobiales bacterium]|nr:SAM-dependent methyltransferase [Acidimicrobiales bacterium]